LYQQLTPKMQTELISKIFSKFIKRFQHFFNSCETGFRNEFIIQLYVRLHRPNVVIQDKGREADEFVLILTGCVELYSKNQNKFMILPVDSIFNDYNLLFNLKSNIEYKSFSPEYVSEA